MSGMVGTWCLWEKVMEDTADIWVVWLCEADSESCEDLGQCCISSECRFQVGGDTLWSPGTQVASLTGQCHLLIFMREPAFVLCMCIAAAMLEVLCLISLVFTTALQSRWRNESSERLSHLLKVTQLMNNGATSQSQVCVIPKPCSLCRI